MYTAPICRRGFNLPEVFLGPDDLRWADMIRGPRGRFRETDSTRTDVAYEDWHGVPLDRALLTLLQRFNR